MIQNQPNIHADSHAVKVLSVPWGRGAISLHNALCGLNDTVQYPFDNPTAKLWAVSELLPESDFRVGTTEAVFFRRFSESLGVSLQVLLMDAEMPGSKYHREGLLALAGYASGKEGIDSTLRFFRWQHYSIIDDAPELGRIEPEIDILLRDYYGKIILSQLWAWFGAEVKREKSKVVISIIEDPNINYGPVPFATQCKKMTEALCSWLGFEAYVVPIERPASDEGRDIDKARYITLAAYVATPQNYVWPHLTDEWRLSKL